MTTHSWKYSNELTGWAGLTLCLALVLAPCTAGASDTQWRASEVVTSYVSGNSPTAILGFDNNLEICLALREPMKTSALRASGVSFTDSQLLVLRLWALVERSAEGEYRCTVPVIEEPVTGQVESLAQALAEQILAAAGPDIDAFLDAVRAAGWADGQYALLGSYVLDGLMWEVLDGLDAIETADMSAMESGSDFWSGATWISLPPQATKLGTNSFMAGQGLFHASWTPEALRAQEPLLRSALLEELVGIALDPDAAGEPSSLLVELGLVDGKQVTVPVIRAGSEVCEQGGRLAMRIGKAMLATDEIKQIVRLTGAEDESVAMIMAYHWVYPAILGRLEAEGLEKSPVLLGTPGASIAPSVFVTDGEVACVPSS